MSQSGAINLRSLISFLKQLVSNSPNGDGLIFTQYSKHIRVGISKANIKDLAGTYSHIFIRGFRLNVRPYYDKPLIRITYGCSRTSTDGHKSLLYCVWFLFSVIDNNNKKSYFRRLVEGRAQFGLLHFFGSWYCFCGFNATKRLTLGMGRALRIHRSPLIFCIINAT